MRVLSSQLGRSTTPSTHRFGFVPAPAETDSATPTETTTSSTEGSSLPSSSTFCWPSGNSYDVQRSYGSKTSSIPSKHGSTQNVPSKPLFVANDEIKTKRELNTSSSLPPSPPAGTKDNNDDEVSSTATSVTARVLKEAAQHCVRGQELMSSSTTSSTAASPLHESIQEYQSALFIFEQTIGSGFADRRECRSLLVTSQIFYWMGLAFEKLATLRRNEGATKYNRRKSSSEDTIDETMEKYERNAIQSFVSCLRLRYHLLDRRDEEEEKRDELEFDNPLERLVSPVMEIQLVLTHLWESPKSPFCNMSPLESARKLQRLRIATWNEDRADEFMFAIAQKDHTAVSSSTSTTSTSDNLQKALAHYRKALETFTDENHKNHVLRLKIASCYRQSGLLKMKANDDNDASSDFDASVFWYRSALKSFCATVRFPSTTKEEKGTQKSSAQKSSPQPQSPTPSVSSIDDASSAGSLDNDEGKDDHDNVHHKPVLTKHPTYERIQMRIEEILTWKQHQQQQQQKQKQKRKFHKNKVGGVNQSTNVELETTLRDYLRSKMKESISHQIRAEAMLSPTAAWRRKPSKRLNLTGVKLEDEAASTMSSMSVLANALIILRASLRIEETVWGSSHPIVQSIQEQIEVADEEYLTAEEQHAEAAETTQRVQKTTSKTKEYNDFHKHVENLAEENRRLRSALDDSTGIVEASQNSRSMQYQQKSGEPSNDKAAASKLAVSSTASRPVEFVVCSQTDGNSRLQFETDGVMTERNFPANYFVPDDAQIPSKKEGRLEHIRSRCKNLEDELKEANEEISRLNQQSESSAEAQKAKDENALLTNRLARINDELKASKNRWDLTRKELEGNYDAVLEKYEAVLKRLREAESDLQVSKTRCVELEHLETKALEEKARVEAQSQAYLDRCKQAEVDLDVTTKRCAELESNLDKREIDQKSQETETRLERENAELLKRCTEVESELDTANKRCIELETNLEKRKELLETTNANIIESKPDLASTPEQVKSLVVEESTPEKSSDSKQKDLSAENTRLIDRCKELENDIVLTKDQSEKLASGLRDEVTRVEAELRISKDENMKMELLLDGMKKFEVEEKTPLTTRISQLEDEIESLSKEGEDTKSKLEKERDELHEKMEKEQHMHSVMAQEHELSVLALKKEIEAAVNCQKEREDRITELEEQLEKEKRSKEVLSPENQEISATKLVKSRDAIGSDATSIANDVDVAERVHTIEKERLTTRVAELMKEIEMVEEKGKIEKERLENEHLEKIEKGQKRVKELESIVERLKQESEVFENKLQETRVEEATSSQLAALKEEKRSIEQELKDATDNRNKEATKAQELETRVCELEKENEGLKADTTEYNQLKVRFSNLEEQNRLGAQELKEMTDAKEKETRETEILRNSITKMEKDLEVSKANDSEQNQLRETISKLEAQAQEMADEKRNISLQLQSVESTQKEKGKEHDLVNARCLELENELKDTKKMESDRQELLSQQIDDLKHKLELSSQKNAEISSDLQSLKTEQDLHAKIQEEHQDLLEKYDQLEKESKEFQLRSDKNAAIAGQRIIALIRSIDEISKGKGSMALQYSGLEQNEARASTQTDGEKKDEMRNEDSFVQPEGGNLMNRNDELEVEEGSVLSVNEDQTTMTKRIADLKAELATATAYNDNLCTTIESYVEEKKELQQRSIDLEKKIALLEEKISTEQQIPNKDADRLKQQLDSIIEKNREEKKHFTDQISTLEETIAKMEGLNKKLKLDLESSDEKAKELQLTQVEIFVKQISALKADIETINATNKRIVLEKETAEKEAQQLQLKLEQTKEEHGRLSEQLVTLKNALESSTSENKELSSKVDSFENGMMRRESSLDEFTAERTDFNDRISALQKEIDSKSTENDALSKKIASLGEVSQEKEILSNRVSNIEDDLKTSLEENMRLLKNIEVLKNSEIDSKHQASRISELESELQSTRKTNRQLKADIKSLKAQKENATQLKRHIAGIESELESLLTSSIGSLKTKEEENNRLTEQMSRLETELDVAKATNRDLTVQVESSERKEEEYQRVVNRLSEVEMEREAFERTRQSLEINNNSFQEQKEELLLQVSNLEGELQSSLEKNQALIVETKTLEVRQEEQVARISDLLTKVEVSQETNVGLSSDIKSLKEEQKERMSRISDLEAELDASKTANQTLSADIEVLKAQQDGSQHSVDRVSNLEKELSNAKERNKSLISELEFLEMQKQEYDQMKIQVSTLTEDIEKAKDDMNSQNDCLQAKEKQVEDFTRQVTNLERDLNLATQENNRLNEEKKSFDLNYTSINDKLNKAKDDNISLLSRCSKQDGELQAFKNKIDLMEVKAEEDKKLLLQKSDVDRKEKEDLAARCLDLENSVKKSTEENKEITSLLRQKSSQIEALNETVDKMEGLNEKAAEYDFMANQCKELEEELLKTIEFNDELNSEMNSLKEEIDKLNLTIFDSEVELKDQAEELQNVQKSNKGLEKRCASLKKELDEVKGQYKKLEEKIAYPDSVEDGHEWTRLQLTELENRMEDVKKENEVLENRMEDVMEENELLLSRLQEYKRNLEHQKSKMATKGDEDLVHVCKELEKELIATAEMNDGLKVEIEALEKKIEDWKTYAENIENELEEESEALQDAEQKNVDLLTAMDILDQKLQEANEEKDKISSEANQSKDSVVQLLEMQGDEYARIADKCSHLESDLEMAKKECKSAKANVESLTAAKKDLQNMLEEAVQDIHELEESTEKLNAVILAKNEMKKLLDRAELGRDEINEKFGRCKQELKATKEHLDEAHAEKEELSRKLDIEKQVSSAYKSDDENEFDELYRNARNEMKDMEIMLEESRACVTDLEENVQILQHQLQAALTFKLQQPKAKPRPNRKFFGWRGGNRVESKESQPAVVVTDDDMDDGHDEFEDDNYEKETIDSADNQ